jgi:hypothetical protein
MKLRLFFLFFLFLSHSIGYAEGESLHSQGTTPKVEQGDGPWFTGPLLAPAGKTIPPGYFNFEPYAFYTVYPAGFRNFETVPILTAGVWDFLDIQTSVPYDFSWDQGQHGNNIGDYSIGLGLQILTQKGPLIPDFRLVIQEVLPTGRYDNLNPNKLGTDQTGMGAYQTIIGFNFQRLMTLPNYHYLRARFSAVIATSSTVSVENLSVFGGAEGTDGNVRPGNSYTADLAFEYVLTQHWVPVFEAVYVNSSTTTFSGNPGFSPGGTFRVGGPGGAQISLAPAIEYNFNANLGVIGGVWFSANGPAAAQFTSFTLAINYIF